MEIDDARSQVTPHASEVGLSQTIISVVPQSIHCSLPRKGPTHKQYEAVKRRFAMGVELLRVEMEVLFWCSARCL